MVIPKGSKLVGHVTEASARGNGETESALGIVFDKAILKNGEEIPLNVAIQALASAQGGPSMAGDEMDTMGGLSGSAAGSGMAGGRGAIGGVSSAAGGAVGTVTTTGAAAGGAGGGTVGGAASAGGSAAGAPRRAAGGRKAPGELTPNGQGVFGRKGCGR